MTRQPLSKRMTRALLEWPAAALLASAALLALPQAGRAQSDDDDETTQTENNGGSIVAKILRIGGETQNDLGTIWINLADCKADAEVEFRLDQVPSETEELFVFAGESCNQGESRDGEGTDCRRVIDNKVEVTGIDDQRVRLKTADIIRAAFNATDESCADKSATPRIWFLKLSSAADTADAEEDSWGYLKLNIDTDPPSAPTSIVGGRGENEIPITWRVSGQNVDSFEIYVDSGSGGTPIRDAGGEPPPSNDGGADESDTGGATNDMCGSGRLREGGSAEDVDSLVRKSEGSSTATGTKLSADEVGGESAAVAVVALDEADNRSPLSAVECVYIVPTTGFKDALGEDVPQGCPCAAAGPAQLEGMLPIALALGFIAYRRRRRS